MSTYVEIAAPTLKARCLKVIASVEAARTQAEQRRLVRKNSTRWARFWNRFFPNEKTRLSDDELFAIQYVGWHAKDTAERLITTCDFIAGASVGTFGPYGAYVSVDSKDIGHLAKWE